MACVVVVACGTPSTRPAADQRLMAHDEPEPAPTAYRPRPDAAITIAPADAYVPPKQEVSEQTQKVLDAIKAAEEKPTEPVAGTSEEPAADDVETEDGVLVFRTKSRVWCSNGSSSAKWAGFCAPSASSCRQDYGGSCARRDSWSCFQFRNRTSGKVMAMCLDTYGKCERMNAIANDSSDTSDVGACAIFRHDPKAKL